MGVGKLAISLIIIGVLAFGLVAGFSMAQDNKPVNIGFSNSTNGTIALTNVVGGASANLMVPLTIIAGIVFLASVFMVFKKVK